MFKFLEKAPCLLLDLPIGCSQETRDSLYVAQCREQGMTEGEIMKLFLLLTSVHLKVTGSPLRGRP